MITELSLENTYFNEYSVQWTDDWGKVIWSDESRFTLFVRKKERYDINCIVPTIKYGGGGVMVWSCFTCVKRYIEEVLQGHWVPFMQGLKQKVEEYGVSTSKLTMKIQMK